MSPFLAAWIGGCTALAILIGLQVLFIDFKNFVDDRIKQVNKLLAAAKLKEKEKGKNDDTDSRG